MKTLTLSDSTQSCPTAGTYGSHLNSLTGSESRNRLKAFPLHDAKQNPFRRFLSSTRVMIVLIIFLFTASVVQSATRYSRADGNWNSTGTWSSSSTGSTGASVPVAGDNVFIQNGWDVTVTADAACSSIDFTSNATSLTINSGFTLSVSGAINIPRSSSSINQIIVGAGTLNAGSISFTSGGTSVRHQVTISTGTVKVTGNVVGSSTNTSGTITFTGAGLLQLGGSIFTSSDGTLTTFSGSTVEYNALADQIVRNFSYSNLTLSGSGAKTVTGVTVSGNLLLSGSATATPAAAFGVAGNTTLSGTSVLTLGASNILSATPIFLDGGTFRTGATTGFSETVGTIGLSANSTIALGTGNHSLTFSNSSGVSWAGTTLTVTGWTGTAGSSGTAGKIYVGASGLLPAQLAKISFTGYTAGAQIITGGEVVPVAPPPTVSSTFSPTGACYGSLASVVITGTNLTGATAVSFNGVSATTFTVNSATQITATLPATATTGTVSVTTPGGTGTSSGNFTVNPLPTATYTVGGGGAYCTGGSGVDITLTGSELGVTYELWNGASATGTTLAGTGSALTFTGVTAAGTYTIKGINGTNCVATMTGNAVVSVTANLSEVALAPSTAQNICATTSGTQLTATETGGGTITGRQWGKRSLSGGSISDITGATAQTYTPSGTDLGAGTWYIVCTSTPTCGSPVISGEVTVNVGTDLSAVAITATDAQNFCVTGSGTQLTVAETNGGTITGRVWGKRSVSLGTITPIAGATGTTYTPSGASLGAGTWYIVCTSTPTCGSAITSNEVTVSVDAVPTIALSSLAGTNIQTVCINTPITDITYNIGGSGTGATVTGLPAGVTGSFNAGVFTITGSPSTATGSPFNYTVTTTGTGLCAAVEATGTITVNTLLTISLTSATGTDDQSVCINTPITDITYSIGGGATGASVSPALPAGVTGAYNAGVYTISGSPSTTTGSPFSYMVTTTGGGCAAVNASGTIAVNPLPAPFTVTGGGTYLSGGAGLPVGLTGSENGVDYTLSPGGTVVSGTGSAISFGNKTAGTYTVTAKNTTTNCTATMDGSASITAISATNQIFTADGTFTVPVGVSCVRVEAWGGGGAGGGTNNTSRTTGGGGAGGTYTKSTVPVTPGAIAVTVGAGGTGVSNNVGNSGGTSSFGTLVSAIGGGGGGLGNGAPLNGAGALAAIGVTWNGGAGGTGNATTSVSGISGGGGGGAGNTGSGGNAAGIVGGTGGTGGAGTTGGNGANGANVSGDGIAATALSAGGSGGRNFSISPANRAGGAGYRGQVIVSWINASHFTTSASASCAGTASTITVTSTTLASGTYDITYDLSAPNLATGKTAKLVFTSGAPGTGTFTVAATDIPAAGATTLTITGITFEGETCFSTIASGNTATINVGSAPTITQPTGTPQTVCLNGTLTALSVTATAGSGTIAKYEWFSSATETNTGGTSVAVNTSALLTDSYTPVSTTAGTLYYYCVVTNSDGCSKASAVSGAVIVNASLSVVNLTAATTQHICVGGTGTELTAAETGGGTITARQWGYRTVSGSGGITNISATTNKYTPAASDFGAAGTYYVVCRSTPTCGSETTSNEVTVIVHANLSAVAVAPVADQTFCEGTSGSQLTVTDTDGYGNTHVWGKRSVTGGTITAISGQTGLTYTPTSAGLGTGAWFVVCTTSSTCGTPIVSNEVKVTFNALPTLFNVTGSGSYLSGSTGAPVGLDGSENGVDYQLYSGATPVGLAVPGTGSAISFGNHTEGTYTVTATNPATTCNRTMTGSAIIGAPVSGSGNTWNSGTTSFIVPYGVTCVQVEAWGAGAGGSNRNGSAGGGGGGAYTKGTLTGLTPGASVAITVGTGGTAGNPTASPGNFSRASNGSNIITANGGLSVNDSRTGGSGGAAQTVGGIITAAWSGGVGGAAISSGSPEAGGGGGGSARTTANGDAGSTGGTSSSTATPGGAGTATGGQGAASDNSPAATSGGAPGAGGGGRGESGGGTSGSGANGRVTITWVNATNFTLGAVPSVCAGTAATVTVNSTSLANGVDYVVTYSLTGDNITATVQSATMTNFTGGTGTFEVAAANLPNSGSTTVTITGIGFTADCATAITTSNTASITTTAKPTAVITYSGSPYCTNSGLIVNPVISGETGGPFTGTTFDATPAGLSINSATGAITTATSTAGEYTVTYHFTGATCSGTATTTVKITAAPAATISYTGTPFCSAVVDAPVTRTGTAGGTYSVSAGMTIDPNTGAISGSTPGTYTITYTVAAAAGCAEYTTSTTVKIGTPPATVSVAGGGGPFCGTATLTATLTGAGTIYYQPLGATGEDYTYPVSSMAVNATGTYYFRALSEDGCWGPAGSAAVTISANAVTTTSAAVCQGGTTMALTASGPAGASTPVGPLQAGANSTAGTGTPWVGNMLLPLDNIFTSATLSSGFGSPVSQQLKATTFGFTIPANANILGVQVSIGRLASASNIRDNSVQLLIGGSAAGDNKKSGTTWPTSLASQSYGTGTTDKWGNSSITTSQINATDFGVSLLVEGIPGMFSWFNGGTAYVDNIQVTVHYSENGVVKWYTSSTAVTEVATGDSFDPIGKATVLAAGAPYSSLNNTNTVGTYPFWAEHSIAPGCRVQADYVISPSPAVFTATGSTICSSATGTVTLSGSETGMVYQLKNGSDANIQAAKAGTGAALSWSAVPAGNDYKVVAAVAATGSCATPSNHVNVIAESPTATITGVTTIDINGKTTLSPTTGGTWVSNNPSVASVTNSGVVTGLANGTATFTFTSTAAGCSATTGVLTVTNLVGKPTLVVTASSHTVTYGDAQPVLTYTITGFVDGDTEATALTGAASVTSSYTTATPVSASPVTVTAAQGTLANLIPAKYNFLFVNGAITIEKKALTIKANDDSKTYGVLNTYLGTEFTIPVGALNPASPTDAITSVTLSSTGDPVTAAQGTYPIVPSAAVGTGLTNYLISYDNGTLTVNKKALTVTGIVANDKTYDGTTTAILTTTGYALVGIENSDVVTLDATGYTANFDTKNQGTNKDVTVTGLALSGAGAGNYTLTQPTGLKATVNKRAITITAATNTRDYDGGVTAAALPTITTGTLASGDVGTFSETYDNKNQGTGKTLTPAVVSIVDGSTVDMTGNYTVTLTASTNGVINKRAITVTASANTKTYDGDVTAAALPTVTTGSLASGDVGTFSETYDTKEQGTGKTMTPAVVSIVDGTSVDMTGNYTVTLTASTNGIINKREITITAAANTKTYDGGVTALATPTLTGGTLVSGDVGTYSETYDNKNQGIGKTMTPAVVSIVNASSVDVSGNYTVTLTPSTNGVINKREITITAATNTKTYDGGVTAAEVPTLTTGALASGDVGTYSETYDNKNQGSGKTITPAVVSIVDGSSADMSGNYTVTLTASTNGVINKREITVTAAANTKNYDGNTSAAALPTITTGTLATGDVGTFSETYDTKDQGTGKTMTPAVVSIVDGTSADMTGNYTVTLTNSTNGVINKLAITVTASANTKTYDGDVTAAALPTITSGALATGDVGTFSETYDNKNQGSGKTMTPAVVSIVNASSVDVTGNYTVTLTPSTNGVINKRSITITAATNTKTYDGNVTAAAVPTLTGGTLVTGDVGTYSETYDNKNQGTGKTMTPAVVSIVDGSSADMSGNYTVTLTASTNGVINKREITVTAAANTKNYDGNTSAAALPTITTGTLATGDVGTYSETYDNKNQGTGKTMTPAVVSIVDGTSADMSGNYTVTLTTSTNGVINKRAITITASANTKTYDGTTSAAALPTITTGTLATGDVGTYSETYDNKNQGTGKTMTPAVVSIVDAGSADVTGNYTVTLTNSTNGVINKRAITITAVANTKTYDGTTSAAALPTVTTGTLASGDVGTYSETYDNKNQGTGKTMTPAVVSIVDGSSADMTGNYTVTLTTSTNGIINKRAITVTAAANTKNYDGNTSAAALPTVTTGTLASGDVGTYSETYDNKNQGTGKTMTPAVVSIVDGSSVDMTGNYTVTLTTSTNGIINKRAITVTASANTKTYDGNTSAAALPTITTGTLATGDVGTFSETYDNKNQGTGKTMTPAVVSIVDAGSADVTGNYTITLTNSTNGVINKRTITVTASANTKTYDGNTSAAALPTLTTGTLATGDVGTYSETYDTKNQGTGKTMTPAVVSIVDAGSADVTGNYTVTLTNSTNGVINKRAITITASANTKTYDGNTSAAALPTLTSGTLVSGDVGTYNETYDTKNQGTGKTMTPAVVSIIDGASADVSGNYTVTLTTSANGVINTRAVTVTAVTDTKNYDGTTSSSASPLVGTLASGDLVNTAPTQVYDNKDVGTNHVLTASGLTIKDGSNANMTTNYVITYDPSPATGVILARTLTVTAVTGSKLYDGNTSSTGVPTVGALAPGDVVSLAAIQVFDNKNVGTTHELIPSGLKIKNGSNVDVTEFYTITYAPSPATGVITPFTVTVTAQTDTKVYDGTDSSDGVPVVSSIIATDAIGTAPIQKFDTKNVGTGKTLTASGLIVSDGNGGNNYTVNYVSNSTGVITKKDLEIIANPVTKEFGIALTTVPVSTEFTAPGLAAGETIGSARIEYNGTGAAASDPVGTYLFVVVPSGATGGTFNVNNYNVSYVTGTLTVIPAGALTIRANNVSKLYGEALVDNTASTAFSVTGLKGTDKLASVSIEYGPGGAANAPVGGNYNGQVKILSYTGEAGGTFNPNNYSAINPIPGNITVNKKPLTIAANSQSHAYGTTLAGSGTGSAAFTATGLAPGETIGSVTISYADGASASSLAGTYTNAITAAAATGGTFNPANYTISYAQGNITVTKAPLQITANDVYKPFGGSLTSGIKTSGFLVREGDLKNGAFVNAVYISYGEGALSTALGNTYTDQVVPSEAQGIGFNKDNYEIEYVKGDIIVGIPLTITAVNKSKCYDGTIYPSSGFEVTYEPSNYDQSEVTGTLSFTGSALTATSTGSSYVIRPGGLSSTKYTFIYKDGTLTIHPTPTATQVSNVSYGTGSATSAINFGGTVSGTTFAWTNTTPAIGLAASGNGNIPSFTAVNNGTAPVVATIVVTPSANGCVGTPMTFTITVNPSTSTGNVNDVIYCNGFAAPGFVFTSPVAGTTYTWTNSNPSIGFAASGSGNISGFTATNTGTSPVVATVVVTPTAFGVPGTPETFTITVNPAPAVAQVADMALCNGVASAPVTLSSAVSGTTFAWTNSTPSIGLAASGNGNIPSFTAANTVTAVVTATITVTPSANGCAGTPMVFRIRVSPTTTVDQVTDITYCNGASSLGVLLTSPVTGTTYSWTNSATGMGLGSAGTGSIPSFTAINAGAAPIVSTIVVTPSLNGCAGTPMTFKITVNPTSTVVAVADAVKCNGESVASIAFTSPVAGTTFAWTNSASGIGVAASGTGNIPSFTAVNTNALPVVATFVVTPSLNGCAGTPMSFKITVNPSVTIPQVTDLVYCKGATIPAISFAAPATGVVYTWTNSATGIGLAAGGTGNIPSFTATNAGATPIVATITVTASGNGCTSAAMTFKITVNPPITVNAVNNVAYCNTAVTTPISFTNTVNGTVFAWTNSAPGIGLVGSGTGNIPSFTATNTGTAPVVATIVVTPSAGECQGAPMSFTITVNPSPADAGVISGQNVVCTPSTAVAYSVPAIARADSYLWTLPAGATIASGANTASITVNYADNASSGNITVAGVGCVNGKASTLTVQLTPLPGAAGAITGNHTVSAGTTGAVYSVAPITNATKYEWTLPAGATIRSGANTNSITVDFGTSVSGGTITVAGLNDCNKKGAVSPAFSLTVPTAEYSVYPVPNHGTFTAKITYPIESVFDITIHNQKGKVIMEVKDARTVGGTYIKEINLGSIPAGNYYIKFYNGTFMEVKKFIVIR